MSKQETPPADKSAEKPAADPKAQLEAATRKDGILAINTRGDLVRLRPGTVRLAASIDKGAYLEGLKDGWRLASEADLKAKAEAEQKNEKTNPSGKSGEKASGA